MRITMTLSRAHKVAERLRTKVTEAAQAAGAGLGIIRVDGVGGDAQLASLAESRQKALEALGTHATYNQALQDVRAAVGRANATTGVSDLLAEQEAIARRIKLLRDILGASSAIAIQPEELATYRPLTQARDVYSRGETGVPVTLLPTEVRAGLEADLNALQKQQYAVSDRVADANAARIELDLPDELAADLGF